MGTSGSLEVWYEFELRGIRLSTPVSINVADRKLQAKLADRDGVLELHVQCRQASEELGTASASRLAEEMYERLLLKAADGLQVALPPRVVRTRFAPDAGIAVSTTLTHLTDASVVSPEIELSEATLEELASEVEIRVVTPQPPTSAPLYGAISMYSMALQSNNKVVRFLILYSALMLAALFKFGDGRQRKVDDLLSGVNPSLPVSATGIKNSPESLYTKLRNDFIHAEKRGWGPDEAMREIERRVPEFQKDTASVLRGL